MTSVTSVHPGDITADNTNHNDSYSSGVAWGAIIGGAVTAAAVSLILLILGSALGLSTVSPWSSSQSIASFTVNTAIWIIIMQWISSALGGYLTGRMRNKWVSMHKEEVFFRDTAHGFLTWSVATILTATLLTSAATSVVSGVTHAGATVAAGAMAANPTSENGDKSGLQGNYSYYVDSLFRLNTPNTAASNPGVPVQDVQSETTRILVKDLSAGTVPNDDKAYLAQLVATRTGLSPQEASTRVDAVLNQLNAEKEKIKQEAEQARKTAMHVALYIFLSLLIGAFIASSAAALGGMHRDVY